MFSGVFKLLCTNVLKLMCRCFNLINYFKSEVSIAILQPLQAENCWRVVDEDDLKWTTKYKHVMNYLITFMKMLLSISRDEFVLFL